MQGEGDSNQYIVLPDYGFRGATLLQAERLSLQGTFVVTRHAGVLDEEGASAVRVLHSLHEDGPKLVETTRQGELTLRAAFSGLKIVPVVRYQKMRAMPAVDRLTIEPRSSTLVLSDRLTGAPVPGATVLAFSNFRHRIGARTTSDAGGRAKIDLKPGTRLERLYVYGPGGYWGFFARAFDLKASQDVTLRPIDLSRQSDCLGQMFGHVDASTGEGVRVGIVDSGVQKDHPALPNVSGGRNMVFDELNEAGDETKWEPAVNDGEHGTHVAGIVGMRPAGQSVLRGVAPGAEIRSYRVFPDAGGGATNYDIINAIDSAIEDGCHVVNLSLGGGPLDEALRSAVGYATSRGVLVVAAAGNDGRRPVSFPAAYPASVAVSAMGVNGTFPEESSEAADVASPFGSAGAEFIAAFSNYGPQIAFTGPGVGVVSTLPTSNWGVMSGTSMACPAIAGFAASILSRNPVILAMKDEERSRALRQELELSARLRGFGRDFEGFGLPQ